MRGTRFAVMFPLCAIVLTSALWLKGHAEFSSSCLDCVSVPLQVAGMLNGPISLLDYAFCPFVAGHVSVWHITILLLAVGFQWAYIGHLVDTHDTDSLPRPTLWRRTAGALGLLFAFGSLTIAMQMYHVGLLYKAVALAWSLLMAYHFFGFFRSAHTGTSFRPHE